MNWVRGCSILLDLISTFVADRKNEGLNVRTPLFGSMWFLVSSCCLAFLCQACQMEGVGQYRNHARWLAGDHHIHSRFSVGWNREVDPPSPIIGGDAIYPIPMNALMAKHMGLSWMVATDHGGPNHSKVNLERAYPELLLSRKLVPEVIQFFGLEFNSPGADHTSLIIPKSIDEAKLLYQVEAGFDRNEAFPVDKRRDNQTKMIEALRFMNSLSEKPVVIANHPSRSSARIGEYGADDPAELREWNDTAPDVATGMAGAPGHQAMTLNADGTLNPKKQRGGYGGGATMGGFDPMTARLGGFWDSMLGEGRGWWITANSDSHVHYTEGGSDFWPGEYSKTYVHAKKSYEAILAGIRAGRIFVTTGDLISELFVSVKTRSGIAEIGGSIQIRPGEKVEVTIKLKDPKLKNWHNNNPAVSRVDLIVGEITGPVVDPAQDYNPTTRVVERFTREKWHLEGDYLTMNYVMRNNKTSQYLRVRGTNTMEMEPEPDPKGEDPWEDLWFYSNPIFLRVR